MTKEQSTTENVKENTSVEKTSTNADTAVEAVKPKVAKLTFDKLDENQQVQVAEKILQEKKPSMDAQFLMQTLTKAGISKIPSQELQNLALATRKDFATGFLGIKKMKDHIREMYERAVNVEKFTPLEAGKLIKILVSQNGKIVSDRTVRNYLPAEAKHSEKAHAEAATPEEKAEKEAAAANSQPPRPEVRQFIIPVMWVEKIADFAKKHPKEACLLVLNQDNSIKRVTQAVTIEEKGNDGKMHKVIRPSELETTA